MKYRRHTTNAAQAGDINRQQQNNTGELMKFLIPVLAAITLSATSGWAQQIDTSQLSKEQMAAMIQQLLQAKNAPQPAYATHYACNCYEPGNTGFRGNRLFSNYPSYIYRTTTWSDSSKPTWPEQVAGPFSSPEECVAEVKYVADCSHQPSPPEVSAGVIVGPVTVIDNRRQSIPTSQDGVRFDAHLSVNAGAR
jgi:hypothetical protein